MKKMTLVEKYDFALSYFIGVENVDKIVKAETEEEIIDALLEIRKLGKKFSFGGAHK